jgi:hypothetical protein
MKVEILYYLRPKILWNLFSQILCGPEKIADRLMPTDDYMTIFKCLFVWQLIGSAPGHDRDLEPDSLEPVWPVVESREKIFRKAACGQITEVKFCAPNALLWEKFFEWCQ